MTYLLDPYGFWEKRWELINPEPFPQATFKEMDGYRLRWRTEETVERSNWHKRKWEAFKAEFPNWKDSGEVMADQFRGKKP